MEKATFQKLIDPLRREAGELDPEEPVFTLDDLATIVNAACDGMRTKLNNLMKERGTPLPKRARDNAGEWKKRAILDVIESFKIK